MSGSQLVDAYESGQVSRRTFIRRLFASGVSLATAATYADLLIGDPAAAAPADDFYCGPSYEAGGVETPVDHHVHVSDLPAGFSPSKLRVAQGECVRWHFHNAHSVRNNVGFLRSSVVPPIQGVDTYTRRFVAAGRFPYRCGHTSGEHAAMRGAVTVPMMRSRARGRAGTRFFLTWAAPFKGGGNPSIWDAWLDEGGTDTDRLVFDVQIRRPGDRRFRNWKQGTSARRGGIRPRREGTYRFRSRVRNKETGRTSAWSPVIRIFVV